MLNLTPIRVRGKRDGSKAQKFNFGKQRQIPGAEERTSAFQHDAPAKVPVSTHSDTVSRSRRKRVDTNLSLMEKLPTEVLQNIFECSGNVNLPLSCRVLASQLRGRHLQALVTSRVLEPVLHVSSKDGIWTTKLKDASRLMDSRFFTWAFFVDWLQDVDRRRKPPGEHWDAAPNLPPDGCYHRAEVVWRTLEPHTLLHPPLKLLRRPFTADRIMFLDVMVSALTEEPDDLDPIYQEQAQRGLEQAIDDSAHHALDAFWSLGAVPDTELLRKAVIDAGCVVPVVAKLITRTAKLRTSTDLLDPMLWSWADEAKRRNDEKGQWLVARLREGIQIPPRSRLDP